MPIVLLIDGYNIIAPVAAPRNPRRITKSSSTGRSTATWLEHERKTLIGRLAKHLPTSVRENTCVVFDAKTRPTDLPSRTSSSDIEIRFAVDHAEADDLIEEIIASHSVPKSLTVVSSDHRIQAAARRRKCVYYDSQDWFDDLLDGHIGIAKVPTQRTPKPSKPKSVTPPPPSPRKSTSTEIPADAPEIDDATLSDLLRDHGQADHPE